MKSAKTKSTAKTKLKRIFIASLFVLYGQGVTEAWQAKNPSEPKELQKKRTKESTQESPPASAKESPKKSPKKLPQDQISIYDDPNDRQTYIERRFPSPKIAAQALEKKLGRRLQDDFAKAGLSYPPDNLLMLATKNDKKLTVYIKSKGKLVPFKTYEIIGVSGVSGPKLQEGDKQIPEGIYKIVGFRTDVQAYMALMVDYPNSFDKQKANADKKRAKNLGSDILIHGSRYSSGCLAMGNPAIEELFLLTYKVRPERTKLIMAPCDLRAPGAFETALKQAQVKPEWLPELYRSIKDELTKIE